MAYLVLAAFTAAALSCTPPIRSALRRIEIAGIDARLLARSCPTSVVLFATAAPASNPATAAAATAAFFWLTAMLMQRIDTAWAALRSHQLPLQLGAELELPAPVGPDQVAAVTVAGHRTIRVTSTRYIPAGSRVVVTDNTVRPLLVAPAHA